MLHRFALLGLIIGFVAVCMAAFENNFIRPPAPPPDTSTLKETASKAAKKWLDDKILHAPKTAPLDRKELPHHPYQMFYIGLGLVAVGLGVASCCRRENLRMSGGRDFIGNHGHLLAMGVDWGNDSNRHHSHLPPLLLLLKTPILPLPA